jgi:beta-glucoside operon transcriptional antiterminator
MKIIKHINNNFAIAIDDNDNELIVSGKGIGFGSIPREITDLDEIKRSYYDIDPKYYSMVNTIPEEIIEIASQVIDYARLRIDVNLSSNIVFTLADHINFAITRAKKNIKMSMPILHDVENLYETEMDIGKYALKTVREKLKIYLPKEEGGYIALHIINAEEQERSGNISNDKIIEEVTQIIETTLDFTIEREGFNYSRFVSHMHYLLKGNTYNNRDSDKGVLYEKAVEEYPEFSQCADIVENYLSGKTKQIMSKEDKLYLILHIHRLFNREVCNR